MKKILLSILPLIILASSCEEIQIASNILEVKFENFRVNDTTLVVSFRDGDGDIGIYEGDTTIKENFYLTFLKFDTTDGKFVELTLETEPNFRIPYIPEPEGVNKSLIGEIEINLTYAFPLDIAEADSFYLRFYMEDRALHKSNVDSMKPAASLRYLREKH